MAAAALLRSMARKLARAPPPAPRGIHGGARSGPAASLPPLTSNQTRQLSGDRLGVGMAATAGLRSAAALPSLATKIARAPSLPHHRHILNRGLHSGSTPPPPPPTTDKDKLIEELRLHLWHARAASYTGGAALTGIVIYMYFWLVPAVEKERERLRKLKPEDDVSQAQVIARKGHIKQQRDAITEIGKRVDKFEEDVMALCFNMIKEASAVLGEKRADLKELRADTARMSPPEQNEC